MKHLNSFLLLLLLLLPLAGGLRAQETAETTTYYQVTKLNDPNGNLMEVERQIMLPYFQERVNRGELLWHGMYRVKYPSAEQGGFSYVAVGITNNFANLDLDNETEVLKAALPDAAAATIWQRVSAESDVYSSEVFVGLDRLASGEPEGGSSHFVQVNYMDVMRGKENAYVKMESDLWKPVHAAQVKKGALNDWLLVQRIMPGGSDFGPSYVTVDGFTDWAQIEKNNREMFNSATSVYPGEDLDKKLGSIEDVRNRIRSEIWELVAETTAPARSKLTSRVINEGTGPHPMRGQEVAYNVTAKSMGGELLFSNQAVVGIPIETVMGSEPYDPISSQMLAQIGAGGKIEATIPLGLQDMQMRNVSQNKDMQVTFELLQVGESLENGTKKLKAMMANDGLAAAKAWYQQASNGTHAFHEWPMNMLGYELMEKGQHEAALFVLTENQRAHPQSFNTHDSLGDVYRAMGDHVKAAKHYDRAVRINPKAVASKNKLAALKR